MTQQQQSSPVSPPAGPFAHELGSSNSTQINNARCPFPSSSLLPPSSSPPTPPSSAHGHVMLDHPLCLAPYIHSIPLLFTTSDALELEYSVPPFEESPFHPDTTSQSPFLASSEFIPDDQEYDKVLYMTDTDEEIRDKIFESLQFEGLLACYERESLVADSQSYTQDDDICLLQATSLLSNPDTHFPATMSENISNITGPHELPNGNQDTYLKCFNQEHAISFPGGSSPAALNVTHGYVEKEAAYEWTDLSDLIEPMSEQINLYDDRGAYTVTLSVNTEKLNLHDGYHWRKYGRKKIMSKRDDHPRDYLKCARKGCPARKRAELSSDREGHSIFTYKHRHNHHPYR